MNSEFDLLQTPLAGANLIEAGAGTGKTYNIAGLYIRLLLEKRLKVNEILVVTFTIAATEELKDRIRRKIIDTINALHSGRSTDTTLEKLVVRIDNRHDAIRRLELALKGFDEATIFTIHGFCRRVLHDHAFESGGSFATDLIKSQYQLLNEIAADFWRKHIYNASPLLIGYLSNKSGEKIDSPEKILQYISRHYSKPFLKIIPKVAIPQLIQLEAEYRTAFESFREAWLAYKDEVTKLLLNNTSLKQNIYKSSSISEWLMQLDMLAAKDSIDANLFDKFVNLTTTKIDNSHKKDSPRLYHPFFNNCQTLHDKHQQLITGYDTYVLALKYGLHEYLQDELKKRKARQNVIYYDDLLSGVNDALTGSNGERLAKAIRKKYKAALIDEFQDTDPVQYNIFKTIFSDDDSILFLIGDPKQAIYGFRGADIFAYMEAISEVDKMYTLSTNWRSDPELIAAINEIFKSANKPFIFDKIPFLPATAASKAGNDSFAVSDQNPSPLQIWYLSRDTIDPVNIHQERINKQAARNLFVVEIAAEISRLLTAADKHDILIGDKPLRAVDIAILVRTNSEAAMIKETLSEYNVPSVLFSDKSVFQTDEADQLCRVLAAIAEPGDYNLIRAALATDILGYSADEIYRLINDDAAWENCLIEFHSYADIWRNQGFMTMFRKLSDDKQIRVRMLQLNDGERRLTNILHLSELLHKQLDEANLSLSGAVKWLTLQRQSESQGQEESQLRLESDENSVRIVTIHKSKGLEYPIVFCPFNWGDSRLNRFRDNIFHNPNFNHELTLDLGSENYDANKCHAEIELLAENLRLLYVALTRAKYRCYLSWGLINQAGSSAIAYLLHQPILNNLSNIIVDTEQNFAALTDNETLATLSQLTTKAQNTINIEVKPSGNYQKYTPLIGEAPKLTLRKFTGEIDRTWRISSFSHLSSGKVVAEEMPDYDSTATNIVTPSSTITQIEPTGIFAFPKGARPGVFFHDLFEHFDFACDNDDVINDLIRTKLHAYNYPDIWQDTVIKLVNNTIRSKLNAGDNEFQLSYITLSQRLNELEFYFPLNRLTSTQLSEVFHKHKTIGIADIFPEAIGKLQFAPVRGFMKGFIDLVFNHNNKYYIVDWKSNHLGNNLDDYKHDKLIQAMLENYYPLQYYIYTLALHRYLMLRLPGYEYDRDFGGVFYLFIRGMDSETAEPTGIFYDKPSPLLIDDLNRALIPG